MVASERRTSELLTPRYISTRTLCARAPCRARIQGFRARSRRSGTPWKAPAVSDGAGALTRVARVTSDRAGNKWLLYRSPSLWDIYIRETLCFPQKESGRGHKTLKGALFTKCTSPPGRPRVLSDMPLTGARAQGHAPTGAARVPSGSDLPSAPHGITRTR